MTRQKKDCLFQVPCFEDNERQACNFDPLDLVKIGVRELIGHRISATFGLPAPCSLHVFHFPFSHHLPFHKTLSSAFFVDFFYWHLTFSERPPLRVARTSSTLPKSPSRRSDTKLASGEVPPDRVEFATFQRTHTQESEAGTRRWINNTSRQIAEGFQKLQEETRTQVTDDGTASSQGASASSFKSTKRPSKQLPSVSEDELARMRAVTAKLEAELQQQKE
ncbi:uncharacterized protein LOC133313634 [Gastrolobium bilobum]|uniref:uncharacterized protein LOC133313634 n=1 Tax=Gastrolobium bilobum TaxID=150636 RepID=UPI002AB08A68|nr:uncharacterized protein LOC133313634 [Gastrolobium bilobum]